jgi:hypothetical protein
MTAGGSFLSVRVQSLVGYEDAAALAKAERAALRKKENEHF